MTDYYKHIFVCTNLREDMRKSSCGKLGINIRTKLIEVCSRHNYDKLKIRVNQSGCLDKCEFDMIYTLK